MTRNWWEPLPPAQAEVSCGDKTHRLRWERGKLTALDHPDTEEELVLAALGGDRSENPERTAVRRLACDRAPADPIARARRAACRRACARRGRRAFSGA